ncbi:MAG: methyltransferase domain-containing protein [Candidatus Hermodarchaeota archaeon]
MEPLNFHDFSFVVLKDVLNNLKELLIESEYASGYIQRLHTGYGLIHAPRRKLTYGNTRTESLLSFFAENKALTIDQTERVFTRSLRESLEKAKIIVCTNKAKYQSVFRIVPLNQFFLLVPFRRFCEPPVYIGADSVTFHRYIQIKKTPKNILDLSTGSGFQLFALPWQGADYSMLGIDINPNAIATATLNAQWNNCTWMEFQQGDVTKDLENFSKTYDLILGNLPILPTPEDMKTRIEGMIHADGGEDGFKVIRRILPAIPNLLSNHGTLQLILVSLGSDKKPDLLKEIEKKFNEIDLKGRITAIKKIPVELDSYYRGQTDYEEYQRWMNFYNRLKKTYWYRLILRAEKKIGKNEDSDKLTYIELLRTDFSKPPNRERVTLEKIRRDINHFLADTLLSKSSKQEFNNISKKIEKEILKSTNLEESITDYGKKLAEKYPDVFPTAGAAIRFWGQVTAEFRYQPKYLERVLW